MKIGDPWLLPPQIVENGCIHIVWMTYTVIVRERFYQTIQTTKYHTRKILYNISSYINKQTNNYIMQDHAKQGYIFGHLSLIQNLALDIPSGVAIMRDRKR